MIKQVKKAIQKAIIILRIDRVLPLIAGQRGFLRKLIPGPALYSNRLRIVKRDKAYFEVDLSDYMQWHIFSGLKEIAWQKATETVSPGAETVIMDIGCNVGAFTIKAACNTPASANVKIIAFDPNPLIEKKFLKNLGLNKTISKKVSFHLAAVGNENKLTDFSFDMSNTGAGHIGGGRQNAIQTRLLTLDSFVNEHSIKNIRFIKIDVEGFEPFVFEGAKNTIRDQKPRVYFEVTETWHNKYGKSATDIFTFLLELGYTLYVDKDGKLLKVTDYREELAARFQSNFLAIFK